MKALSAIINLFFGLTKAERSCCHMSAARGLDFTSVRQWRAEFAGIPRDEHCADCPAISSTHQTTAAE